MLEFASGHSIEVNPEAAMNEAVKQARGSADTDVLLIHSTIGHNLKVLLAAARRLCPNASIGGCTGSGVIHSQGVTEAMRALAVMAIKGPEIAVVFREGVDRSNGKALAAEAARELRDGLGAVRFLLLFTGSFDVAGDHVINGIEEVFGSALPIFGAMAADNGKVKGSFQFANQVVTEHGLVLLGIADKTLDCEWVSHHGSIPVGEPFKVTAATNGQVLELNGRPAWPQIMARLGLPADTPTQQTLPIAGLGLELLLSEQAEYDNSHILRVPLALDGEGGFFIPASVPVGSVLSLMQRDEEKIFAGVKRMMERLQTKIAGRSVVAVLQSDCMARGRLTFNRVLKDDIIARIQLPLVDHSQVPWLGVYGYSEFCPLRGRNAVHSYTTSLLVFLRNGTVD